MTWSRSGGATRGYGWQWCKARAAALARDGGQCTILDEGGRRCGQPAHAVDHVKSRADGGTDDLANLRSVCRWHHSKITAQQAAKARSRQRREPERHPGLLP